MANFRDSYDAAFVSAFDNEYRNAKLGSRPVELPVGRYQFVVTEFKVIEKNNFNVLGLRDDQYYEHMIVTQLKVITEGEFNGAIQNKYNGICLANIRRIKSDLNAMGHEFEGLDNLFEVIENGDMIGVIVDGHVTEKTGKNGKNYHNLWLDRCVGRMTPEQMGGGFNQVDDDDELPWGR